METMRRDRFSFDSCMRRDTTIDKLNADLARSKLKIQEQIEAIQNLHDSTEQYKNELSELQKKLEV